MFLCYPLVVLSYSPYLSKFFEAFPFNMIKNIPPNGPVSCDLKKKLNLRSQINKNKAKSTKKNVYCVFLYVWKISCVQPFTSKMLYIPVNEALTVYIVGFNFSDSVFERRRIRNISLKWHVFEYSYVFVCTSYEQTGMPGLYIFSWNTSS